MAWNLLIEFEGAVPDFDFSVEPITTPTYDHVYDEGEPPTIVEVNETWEIEEAYLLPSPATSDMIDAFNAFKATLQDRTDKVSGVVLLLDAVEKFRMDASTHSEFKFNNIRIDKLENAGGTSFIKFAMTVTGVQRLDSGSNGIASLKQTLDRRFSNNFETRTLRTELTTIIGSSATSAAQVVGLLTLPGANWTFVTVSQDDPNVDITVNDQPADTKVTATCTIREQGLAFPGNVHDFTTSETTIEEGFDREVRVSVTARGAGAEAAVNSQRPTGTTRSEITVNPHDGSVTGTFTIKKNKRNSAEPNVITRRRSFSVDGGGKPRVDQPIMGSDDQFTTFGARTALRLTESISLSTRRPSAMQSILLEKILFPDNFVLSESSETMPKKVEDSFSPSGEKWERTATRVYMFSKFSEYPSPAQIVQALLSTPKLQQQADFQEGA